MTVRRMTVAALLVLMLLPLMGAGVIYATAKPYQRDRIEIFIEQTL